MTGHIGLSRFLPQSSPATVTVAEPAPAQRCELCTRSVADEHSHLVDLSTRALICSCRACYLLFTPEGAGGGRYRPVPERYLHDADFRLTAAEWEELAIPVGVVFVFHHSGAGEPVAFYPSPAGATQSLLPLRTWAHIMRANPRMAAAVPDVEAILLRRSGDVVHGFLVPIDACYELAGQVRLYWRGFSGGEDAWRRIDGFFDRLVRRAEPARAGAEGG